MHASTLQGVLDHLRKLTDPARAGELSDADLLERFRLRREEAAFALLVQRHGPMVLAVCRRILGDVHLAEDAFQATFLVLVRNASTIRKQQSLAAWLHGTAARIAHKARLRTTRQHCVDQAFQPDVHDDPSDPLIARELRAALDEEIARLPAKYRTPLVLCFLAEKTHEQAASELGWPKSSVTARLAKARELLRQRLMRRGFTVPAGLLAALLAESSAEATVPSLLTLSTVRVAVQALLGETLAATSAVVLAGSLPKCTTALKLTAMFGLLTMLGLAVVGYRLALSGPSSLPSSPALKAPTLREPQAEGVKTRRPRVDRFGDPLPDEALARMDSGRMRHTSLYIPCPLAFSPDGKWIVSGGNGSLRIWDAATGKLWRQFVFDNSTDLCRDFVLRPDAITVVSGLVGAGIPGDGILTIHVFDPSSGKVRRKVQVPERATAANPVFSPDGKRLAYVHEQNAVRIYDVTAGRETLRIALRGNWAQSGFCAGWQNHRRR
jgi:RNA polymerase sigma factor (sigma-70 family)